jgi:predicted nucleic acid-binding protein
MSNAIKENYIGLTRKYKIELPDALIAAASLTFDMPFITADKGFQKINEINLVLYHHSIDLTDRRKSDE